MSRTKVPVLSSLSSDETYNPAAKDSKEIHTRPRDQEKKLQPMTSDPDGRESMSPQRGTSTCKPNPAIAIAIRKFAKVKTCWSSLLQSSWN